MKPHILCEITFFR